MGKLLRVLVVVFLLLSLAGLGFGVKLFGKREVLKGRTQKLEAAVIQVGGTIEAQDATLPRKQDYPARDISPVTSEAIESPELSKFWDTYDQSLELADQPMLDLNKQRYQLMSYYKLGPDGKPLKDPLGQKITTGEGTTQGVLDELENRAEAQLHHLNKTREELKNTRTELVDTITDLNDKKATLRKTLKDVDDQKVEITKLGDEVKTQKAKADELAEQQKALEDQVGEQKRQIGVLQDDVKEKTAMIDELTKAVAKAKQEAGTATAPTGAQQLLPGKAEELNRKIEPGDKGRVVAVDKQWNFVIVELSDEFLKTIMLPEGGIPAVELMVKRPGEPSKFVTKIRLVSLKKNERLAIADVLSDWEQLTPQVGDIVFR